MDEMARLAQQERRRRNPAAAGDRKPFPRLDPEYPLKAWVISPTGQQVQTVTVQQDDGTYLAVVLSDRSIRFTAHTRKEAERGALRRYRERRAEDNADHQAIVEAENDSTISLDEFLKRAR